MFIGTPFETVMDYFIDFITIVGTPELFDEKVTDPPLTITNYRADLPIDFVDVVQLSINKHMARYTPDTHAGYYDKINEYLEIPIPDQSQEVTFRIKGNYIYTSKETGDLLMVYKCIKVQDDVDADDYGFPMIPDDPVFIKAFRLYVEKELLKSLWRIGKVDQRVYEDVKQEYAWAVGQYETHAKRLDLSKMETISRLFRSLQYKNNEFYTRFRHLGTK